MLRVRSTPFLIFVLPWPEVSPATAARWVSMYYAGITVGRLITGFITMKISSKLLIRYGQLILFTGAVLLLLPLNAVFSLVGFILIGLGCAPIYPCMIHETPKRFGEANSQKIIGVQMACAYTGSTFLPPILGFIASKTGIFILPAFLLLVGLTFAGTYNMVKRHIFVYLFGVMFLAVSSASLVLLYKINLDIIIFLIAMLAFNDVTGYFAGRKFGKIKTFKTLSPKKTLEGYIGGLAGLMAGLILFHTVIPVLDGTSLWKDLILLATFFIFGNAGDLLFSKIKRSVGIKDFSGLLPGHGGILDRFDSALTVSPLLLVLLYLN
jgi:CDP-diglyceride synthetase